MGDGQPRLLGQVRDGIRRKHYSIGTEQAYVEGIRRFVLHYNKRHSRDMGAAGVEALPTHLAAAKRVSFFPGPRSCSSRS
jgi:Phage integrase, N-terminal SAM-like domain